MFATLSRFRRHVAVLTALAMVASVLVAAPVAAADAKPDYMASFDACMDAPSSDFEDVPASHTNAGDIDCIAYYGITKGTSATTYSPVMSVTREHMALFLTRLAGLVGIDLASDPDDAGFTDIGELSAESQTAIAQLADLGITKGTSDTTFSPSDSVRRDHMALFIARLMDKMDTITDADGHTPSEVAALEGDVTAKDIGSPYTDLGSVTKSAYDAITQLYELGVASGISDTAYGPAALITRASMAGFMAAVLDHSNVRPAGVSIQASKTSGYGEVMATVIVSYRDAMFMPVADKAIDIFNSEAAGGGLDRHGKCASSGVEGDCTWNANDEQTDEMGNIPLGTGIGPDEGGTLVYYAWIGAKDGDKFDKDTSDYQSVSITSMKDEASVKVSDSISEEAGTTANGGENHKNVHLGATSSVTITLQLKDAVGGGGGDVARSGIKFTVNSVIGDRRHDGAAVIETDSDGLATYTVTGPTDDKSDTAQQRFDTITFEYEGTDTTKSDDNAEFDNSDDGSATTTASVRIAWIEVERATASAKATADAYVVPSSSGKATVSASVTFYDQYGKTKREGTGQMAGITIGASGATPAGEQELVRVNHRGVARHSANLDGVAAGTPVSLSYAGDPAETPNVDVSAVTTVSGPENVQAVGLAAPSDTGDQNVHMLFAKDNKFTTHASGVDDANLLFSYDENDTFLSGATNRAVITMDKFEELLANPAAGTANVAVVDVVSYSDTGGSSIFVVTTKSDGNAP